MENIHNGEKVFYYIDHGVTDWEIHRLTQMIEECIIQIQDVQNPVPPMFITKDFHSVKVHTNTVGEAGQLSVYDLKLNGVAEQKNRTVRIYF